MPIKKKCDLDDLDCARFRPVNLLSPISKLMEKVWAEKILKHLIQNKLIDYNHQGGIPNRSSTFTVANIYQMLAKKRARAQETALVTMDQSAAYDICAHALLKAKLLHLGIHQDTVSMIMNYYKDRKQQVYINGNFSDILLTGPVSVTQGSVMSGLMFACYTLDIHCQSHAQRHVSHSEYMECNNDKVEVYIDDTYGIIEKHSLNIWDDIKRFIQRMEDYFNNNLLVVNVKKTLIML